MMLADMGADVVRIDRPGGGKLSAGDPAFDVLNRGRRSIALDLKDHESKAIARALCDRADVVLEGFRPGVMERLGFGPTELAATNSALVYARMTGWGQHGALADKAGHDINYIAMSGALSLVGEAGKPPLPPINFFADFGGGATFVVTGILAALIERAVSGTGQVIDAAMIDGSALLTAQIHGWRAMGFWSDRRSDNILDGAAYFYRCYQCADGKYLAVGAIEPQFHAGFVEGLGLPLGEFANHLDRSCWLERSARIAAIVATRRRDEWAKHFAAFDACVSPVLTIAEALAHPANRERALFGTVGGVEQPMPAPRFSRTPSAIAGPPALVGQDSDPIRARLAQSDEWPD